MVPYSLPMNANPAPVQRQVAGIHTLGMTGSIPVVWTDRPYGAREGAMRLIAENGRQWAVTPYRGGYVVVRLPMVEDDGEVVGDARVWHVEVTPRAWAVLRGGVVYIDDTPRTVAPDATARDCGLPLRWLRKAVAP